MLSCFYRRNGPRLEVNDGKIKANSWFKSVTKTSTATKKLYKKIKNK